MEQNTFDAEVEIPEIELPDDFQSACLRCNTDPDSTAVIELVSLWASEKGIKLSFIPVSSESDPGYDHLPPYGITFIGGAVIEAKTLDGLSEQLDLLNAWLVENI